MALSDTTAQNYELRDPDVRLMLQVRDDNAAAFEELVVRYQGRLITVLEQLVHKRDVAEDLAQEVFLRVFRARKTYQPGAKFSTWLFTIANNVASNALRSLARRREVRVAPHPEGDSRATPLEQMALAASGLMPTRQLDHRERAEVVRQAIRGLKRAAEDGADALEVRRHELSGDRAGDGFVHPGGQVAVVACARQSACGPGAVYEGGSAAWK